MVDYPFHIWLWLVDFYVYSLIHYCYCHCRMGFNWSMECSNATRTSSRYIGREQILSNKTAYTLPFYKFFSFRYLCKTIFNRFNLKIVIVSTHCCNSSLVLSVNLSLWNLISQQEISSFVLPNEFLWDGSSFHHDVKSLDL